MPRSSSRSGRALAPLLLLGVVILGVVAFVISSNRRANDEPVPVVWDKTPCAHCAMHLGDPRFAAQLTTGDGTTHFYDDPGCLFLHREVLMEAGGSVHAMWFRDMNGDAWISADEASFLRTDGSPMNFGFGAVQHGMAGSLSLLEVEREILGR